MCTQYKDEFNEWKNIFDKENTYYIYGAANNAKQIIAFAETTNVLQYIKGCVVTNGEENSKEVCGVPVFDIHLLNDEQAVILLPHTGIFKREIVELLNSLGYTNVVLIHKYLTSIMKTKVEMPNDIFMKKTIEVKKDIIRNKSEFEMKSDEEVCKKISEIRAIRQPDFGEDKFYQSMEAIGLDGKRPTLYRIEKYGLKQILGKEKRVLDIGCNTGFIDLTIAPLVKGIIGVEYDDAMVEIANVVREHLNINNCNFYARDFKDWVKENDKKFDVILSFAIHHWVNISVKDFVKILDNLLNKKGYICIESHDLQNEDKKFDRIIELLLENGYVEHSADKIKDDGLTIREYKILQKL